MKTQPTKLERIVEYLARGRRADSSGELDASKESEASQFLEESQILSRAVHDEQALDWQKLLLGDKDAFGRGSSEGQTGEAVDADSEKALQLLAALGAGNLEAAEHLVREELHNRRLPVEKPSEGGVLPFVEPSGQRRRIGRRSAWNWVLLGSGTAAAVLMGMLIGRYVLPVAGPQSPARRGQLLLGRIEIVAQYRPDRSGKPVEPMARDSPRIYLVKRRPYELLIQSDREGFATLVLLAPSLRQVYPRSSKDGISIDPSRPQKYGPLEHPAERTIVLVMVTESPASGIVRKVLDDAGVSTPLDQLEKQIQDALTAHYSWVAAERIIVEPAAEEL
jgi:hypothetical protein